MARPAKVIEPLPGVYKNGTRYWIRTVRSPLSSALSQRALSTGTTDVVRANAIRRMVDTFAENPTQYHWLDKALGDEVSLDALYTHHAAGTLPLLAEQLMAAKAQAADADLRPFVKEWASKVSGVDEVTKANYIRQVRFFIPEDEPLPRSAFTEDYIQEQLATLTGARHDRAADVSDSTKRRYLVPLALCIRFLRRKGALMSDPLADIDWMPGNGSPRSVFHEFDKVQSVLAHLDGEDRRAMSMIYGSGIELGAFLRCTAGDVGKTLPDGRGMIVARGSKNEHREDRTIFVDAWAWPSVQEQTKNKLPMAALWSYNPKTEGKDLREAFYWAQVKAGLIAEPEKSIGTGKYLWGRVKPHTLHDARHSYCVNRSLGLDGEEPQDASFCANQLGHVDETMVLKIYKKANVKDRLRLIHMQQAQKAARAAGEGR